jgi:hypothetical protein
MNFARVAMAAVAAWLVSIPIGYVVNEILLKDLMVANAAAMRSNEVIMANLPLGFGFSLVGFFAFAYAFAKGYEGGNGTMEGIRFGVLVAIMLQCFAGIWMYIVFPISGSMAVAGLIDGIVEFALYGAIVGTIYKPATSPARHAAAL